MLQSVISRWDGTEPLFHVLQVGWLDSIRCFVGSKVGFFWDILRLLPFSLAFELGRLIWPTLVRGAQARSALLFHKRDGMAYGELAVPRLRYSTVAAPPGEPVIPLLRYLGVAVGECTPSVQKWLMVVPP